MPRPNAIPSQPAAKTKGGRPDRRTRLDRQRDHKLCDAALVDAGRIDFYISPMVMDAWKRVAQQRRGPRGYTDAAIVACLLLGAASGRPLRQTQGYVQSLLNMFGRGDLRAPDHTTLSIRRAALEIPIMSASIEKALRAPRQRGVPFDIVIDGTGMVICGPGAWREHKWGAEPGRRQWWRVTQTSDPITGIVTAVVGTGTDVSEIGVVEQLLAQSEANTGMSPGRVIGDGAYDCGWLARLLEAIDAQLITPPDINATLRVVTHGRGRHKTVTAEPGYEARNRRIRARLRDGDDTGWKQDEHYHQRSLSETVFSRHHAHFGAKLTAKTEAGRTQQTNLHYRMLNEWRANEINNGGGYTSHQAR